MVILLLAGFCLAISMACQCTYKYTNVASFQYPPPPLVLPLPCVTPPPLVLSLPCVTSPSPWCYPSLVLPPLPLVLQELLLSKSDGSGSELSDSEQFQIMLELQHKRRKVCRKRRQSSNKVYMLDSTREHFGC